MRHQSASCVSICTCCSEGSVKLGSFALKSYRGINSTERIALGNLTVLVGTNNEANRTSSDVLSLEPKFSLCHRISMRGS